MRLLTLLRAALDDNGDLELNSFSRREIAWAIEAGLGPWLHRATRNDPGRAANPRWPAVQGAELTARVLTGETLDAATEILAAYDQTGPPVTLLKGISLCEQHYPEPHLRPMGDIDLLVDREGLETLEEVLLGLGYDRRSSYPAHFYATHHHTCPFFRASTEDWVEVHVALFPQRSRLSGEAAFAPANVGAELEASVFGGHAVRRLSAELQVVYLAAHWAFELEVVGAMVPMLDLLLLIDHNPDLDWNRITGWLAGSPTAAAHLYLLISFLDRHRLLDLEPEIVENLRSLQRPFGTLNRQLAFRLLERHVVAGRPFGPLMTRRNFDVAWRTLFLPDAPWRNLCRLPWSLIPERYR